jgi:hypothetical protein
MPGLEVVSTRVMALGEKTMMKTYRGGQGLILMYKDWVSGKLCAERTNVSLVGKKSKEVKSSWENAG